MTRAGREEDEEASGRRRATAATREVSMRRIGGAAAKFVLLVAAAACMQLAVAETSNSTNSSSTANETSTAEPTTGHNNNNNNSTTSASNDVLQLKVDMWGISRSYFIANEAKFKSTIATFAEIQSSQVAVGSIVDVTKDVNSTTSNTTSRRAIVNGIQITVIITPAAGQTSSSINAKIQSKGLPALAAALVTAGFTGAEVLSTSVITASSVACGLPGSTCTESQLVSIYKALPENIPLNFTAATRAEPANKDLGPCVCDLTEGTCDANCPCDVPPDDATGSTYSGDCTKGEVAIFSGAYGVPIKKQGVPSEIPVCLPRDEFLRINAPEGMRLVDSPLCVVRNNNPSVGFFLTPPGPFVSNGRVRQEFDQLGYGPSVFVSPDEQPTVGDYQVGMRIPAAVGATQSGGPCSAPPDSSCVPSQYAPRRYFSLPYPDSNGRCAPGNDVKFWSGTRPSLPCLAQGQCADGGALSAMKYLQGVLIAKLLPGSRIADWQGTDLWTQLTPKITVVERDAQGRISKVWTPQSGVPLTGPDATGMMCTNVLESIHYTVVRAGGTPPGEQAKNYLGQIRSVLATVTLTHVPLHHAGDQVSIMQRHTVAFVDETNQGLDDPLLVAGSVSSGRPGYVNGMPVRAGLVEENTTTAFVSVVREQQGGMTLPRMGSSGGRCAVCANGTGSGWDCRESVDERNTIGVLFGHDVEQGCTIELNREELMEFCKAPRLHPLLALSDKLRVAIYGDSDIRNVYEWMPTPDMNQESLADSRDSPTAQQAYDPRGVCISVVTGTHLQILTADVGNIKNPQRRVIGARLVYETSDWHSNSVSPTDKTKHKYTIKSSVSFLRIDDGGSVEVIPPPPSILPRLPDDIFYPFQISSANGASSPLLLSLLLTAAATLMLSRL